MCPVRSVTHVSGRTAESGSAVHSGLGKRSLAGGLMFDFTSGASMEDWPRRAGGDIGVAWFFNDVAVLVAQFVYGD